MRTAGMDERRGNRAMLAALVVAALVITTVYFREGSRGPFHVARRAVLAAAKPVGVAGTYATYPLRATGAFVRDWRASKAELGGLKRRNAELRRRVAELEEARLENGRLRAMAGFVRSKKVTAIGTHVIGRPSSSWDRTIVIDRGAADGVKPAMPVIAAEGLLGQVVEVAGNSAKVKLITDQSSGVAAFVQSTRAAGIVRGSLDGGLKLEYVEKAKAPKVGDVIVTSGLGGVYPKGIPVGDVVEVADGRSGLYADIVIASRVPIDRIEDALVLTQGPPDVKVGDGE